MGVAAAVIFMALSPYVHSDAPTPIREAAVNIVSLYSMQLIVICLSLLIFLVYLVEKLDYAWGYGDGIDVPLPQIFSPLIVLFSLLMITYPVILMTIRKYQQSFLMVIQFHEGIHAIISRMRRQNTELRRCQGRILLEQIHGSLYRRLIDETPRQPSVVEHLESGPIEETIQIMKVCSDVYMSRDDSLPPETRRDYVALAPTAQASPTSIEIQPRQMTVYDLQETCVVCFSEEINAVLMSCGHAVLCWDCALAIAKQYRSHCPVCRVPILELWKIDVNAIHRLDDGRVTLMSEEGFDVRVSERNADETTPPSTEMSNFAQRMDP